MALGEAFWALRGTFSAPGEVRRELFDYLWSGFVCARAESFFSGGASGSKAAPASLSIGIPEARDSLRASISLSTLHC